MQRPSRATKASRRKKESRQAWGSWLGRSTSPARMWRDREARAGSGRPRSRMRVFTGPVAAREPCNRRVRALCASLSKTNCSPTGPRTICRTAVRTWTHRSGRWSPPGVRSANTSRCGAAGADNQHTGPRGAGSAGSTNALRPQKDAARACRRKRINWGEARRQRGARVCPLQFKR